MIQNSDLLISSETLEPATSLHPDDMPKCELSVPAQKENETSLPEEVDKHQPTTRKQSHTDNADENGGEELKSKRIFKRRGKKKSKSGSFTRRLWNDDEDRAIAELVGRYGIRKWTLISRKLQEEYHIHGRSGKQCRERWHNHVDPEVTKGPLSEKEEEQLFKAQRVHGNKWAEIAKSLKGRTDNVVKNHFYSTLRRQLRKVLRQIKGDEAAEPAEVSAEYMLQIVRENHIPYSAFDNPNVRDLLVHLDRVLPQVPPPKPAEPKYSLRESVRTQGKRYRHLLYSDEEIGEVDESQCSTKKRGGRTKKMKRKKEMPQQHCDVVPNQQVSLPLPVNEEQPLDFLEPEPEFELNLDAQYMSPVQALGMENSELLGRGQFMPSPFSASARLARSPVFSEFGLPEF